MDFVWMLLIGLTIGIVARLVLPRRGRGDAVVTLLLAIGGSGLVGYIGVRLGWYDGAFEGRGLVASILGAVLVLFIHHVVAGRRRSAT